MGRAKMARHKADAADIAGALVVASFIGRLRARGLSVREAVFGACRRRVRPVMMTSLTVLLGLVPMLFATGSGSEIQKPPVAVIFGGMATSLALTLIILPVLYALVNGLQPAEPPPAESRHSLSSFASSATADYAQDDRMGGAAVARW